MTAFPPEYSDEYDLVIRRILVGQLDAARKALDDGANLRPSERCEVQETIAFQRGQMRSYPTSHIWTRCFFHLWLDLRGARRLLAPAMRAFFAFAAVLGLRARWFERLRVSLAPQIVHMRYTNFISGLVYSVLLHHCASAKHNPAEKAYYQGLTGMFECLGGRFDFGLDDFDASFHALSRENENKNSTSLTCASVFDRYMTIATLRAFYLNCAGHAAQGGAAYDDVLHKTRTISRYVYVEIFLQSMRMLADLEMLDGESLAHRASELKAILGDFFPSAFALRASVCASLVATIQGNSALARQQLTFSDSMYSENISDVELARYHVLRSLIHLEFSEYASANMHASRASAFTSKIAGSRYHEAEFLLLNLELRLRSRLRSGDGPFHLADLRRIDRALRSVAASVRGCPLVSLKLRATRAYLDFVQGKIAKAEAALPDILESAEYLSKRMTHVLSEINIRDHAHRALKTSDLEMDRHREATLLGLLARVMRNDGHEDDAAELLALIVGTRSWELVTEPLSGTESQSAIQMSGNSLSVRIVTQATEQRFIFERPLVDIRVDIHAYEMLELAVDVIQLARNKRALVSVERNEAIVRTTQMLAHDVRKPFSMLRMMLDSLRACKSMRELGDITSEMVPEVERAMTQVSGMLQDIMDIGTAVEVDREPVEPSHLIDTSLREIFRIYPESDVRIRTSLKHTSAVLAEPRKILRVLSNIIGNAVQALSQHGQMWITTRDVAEQGRSFVEFCVGNEGSFIPPEIIDRLFDAFVSFGKKGGTGLGLPIARQHVLRHGGRIWCRSSPETGVEFLFTLPQTESIKGDLPRVCIAEHSSAFRFLSDDPTRDKGPSDDPGGQESDFAACILRAMEPRRDRPLRLLLVDDEVFYTNGLEALVERTPGLGPYVFVARATDARTALSLAKQDSFDVVICDVDLGPVSQDGFELAREMRRVLPNAQICIHSNRSLTVDYRRSLEAGADSFLPKPMSRAHLLRLFVAALGLSSDLSVPDPRARLAIVEDSRAVIRSWQRIATDATVLGFNSPEAFLAHVEQNPGFLEKLDAIIVDMSFGTMSDLTGVDLCRLLRTTYASCAPMILSTNDPWIHDSCARGINLILEKRAYRWLELKNMLAASSADSFGMSAQGITQPSLPTPASTEVPEVRAEHVNVEP